MIIIELQNVFIVYVWNFATQANIRTAKRKLSLTPKTLSYSSVGIKKTILPIAFQLPTQFLLHIATRQPPVKLDFSCIPTLTLPHCHTAHHCNSHRGIFPVSMRYDAVSWARLTSVRLKDYLTSDITQGNPFSEVTSNFQFQASDC